MDLKQHRWELQIRISHYISGLQDVIRWVYDISHSRYPLKLYGINRSFQSSRIRRRTEGYIGTTVSEEFAVSNFRKVYRYRSNLPLIPSCVLNAASGLRYGNLRLRVTPLCWGLWRGHIKSSTRVIWAENFEYYTGRVKYGWSYAVDRGATGGTRGTMKIGDTNLFGLCGRCNDVRKICDET